VILVRFGHDEGLSSMSQGPAPEAPAISEHPRASRLCPIRTGSEVRELHAPLRPDRNQP
jgi:hypothetical protein